MMTVLYILIAILLFGILIFIHEFGHYLFARIFKVKINEFAIGMGPKIVSKTSKKTGIAYSWRALPIGGYVSMEGEEKESDDENSFSKKPIWQRIIITAAGATFNIVLGVIVMFIVTCSTTLVSPVVAQFNDNAISCEQLEVGDTIVRLGKMNTYTGSDVMYAISRYGTEPTEVTVIRDGNRETLTVSFGTEEESGYTFGSLDFKFYKEETLNNDNIGTKIKHSFAQSRLMIKMVFDSLFDLITGKYGIKDLSGPVGVVDVVVSAEKQGGGTVWLYFVLIAINLGIMNLLPIPALDGGRIVFFLIELIIRKPVPQKVQEYLITGTMVLLFALMAFVTVKDVIHIIIR